MKLEFFKYEGTGNDFVMLDRRGRGRELPGELVRALCDRHRGVGADGVMTLAEEAGYDFRMTYYNADGGIAAMCGNGGRCIALFAHHLGIGGDVKRFVGDDGEHTARIISAGGDSGIVEIGMIDVDAYEYSDKAFFLNTGVPHYVEFVVNADEVDVEARGREIRESERFRAKGGTNVDFAEITGLGKIKARTYERGVEGETLACGTGAVASAIAAHLLAQDETSSFAVAVPGGILDVSFKTDDSQIFTDIKLTGPARRVFSGSADPDNILNF